MLNPLRAFLRGRHLPPQLARLVPRRVRAFAPPRRYLSATDLAAGSILATEPAEPIPRLKLSLHGDVPDDGLGALRSEAPVNHVFTVRHARLRDADGHIITQNNELVFDAGFWSRLRPRPDRDHSAYQLRKTPPAQHLPGLTVSIASDFAAGGYGHFVHDCLPRLRLLRLAGIDFTKADWIFCPRLPSATVDDLCADLGIAPAKLLNHRPGWDYLCDQLIATTYPGAVGTIAPRDAIFLETLGARWRQAPPFARRVYLARAGCARNFLNEAEALTVLRQHGFEIVDPAAGRTALEACANAAVIAGIDGANLSSLAFAPATARVLVIYPEQAPTLPYQLTLAASAGREVHLFGPVPANQVRRSYLEGFYVNPERFDACLATVCAGLPPPPLS
ncbi:MAG: glycosyltransferase family 61 protein [Verrucomicrobia bacterium]|nr:glycosyltransferase family 61 protein [Verrucomicrobiota bacterium]